ncbi:MAG: hypothetical protein ACI3Y5_01735, partial [Prevotella sp.]
CWAFSPCLLRLSTVQVEIFLLMLFLAFTNVGMAQVRIAVSDIIGTKWKIKDSPTNRIYEYTSERKLSCVADGTRILHSKPYYLTDTPITSSERSAFDYSKVGKGTTGCYLVEMNEMVGTTYCRRIQYFDKEEGIMETKLITDSIISWDDVTVYTLMK